MEHGLDGYKMSIEKEYKVYVIEQKIKSLLGKKQLILEGSFTDSSTELDINNQIQVLTNMLEML
jgi:hypothetical protein